MVTPFVYPVMPVERKPKRLEEAVPANLLVEWSCKLFSLMNLAWGYVDTVLDLCIGGGEERTKPLVRQVRELKRGYDQFRWGIYGERGEADEAKRGELFEELFAKDFTMMLNGIDLEVGKLSLNPGRRMLVVAVCQAMTLIRAAKIYARRCDREIESRGALAPDCCMVQREFLALDPLVTEFAGDCWSKVEKSVQLPSRVLSNRLHNMRVVMK